MNVEQLIFASLVNNEEYVRKTFPYLKDEYFHNKTDKILFGLISEFVNKYSKRPTIEALTIELNSKNNINENDHKELQKKISGLRSDDDTDVQFLVDTTEKFCQEKALYNALMESIAIIDEDPKKKVLDKGAIPDILIKALSVGFDASIGHDYLDDFEERYKYYTKKESRISLGLEYFDLVTNGGLPDKTLTVFLAGPHVGKSLFLCHFASHFLSIGKNVLYITLEMAEEEISKRVDSNLLDIPIQEFSSDLPEEMFRSKINKLRSKTHGKLIIKEYPTAGASVSHFRHLINEMKLKKKFLPDVILIDYLGICASSRLKRGAQNSYEWLGCIIEEVRGLAIEIGIPILSAAQTNRGASGASDLSMADVAESYSLNMTSDAIFGIIATEDLVEQNKYLCVQIKNRLGDINKHQKFIIGVDRPRFRLEDVKMDEINDPVFDKTETMAREMALNTQKKMFSKFSKLS